VKITEHCCVILETGNTELLHGKAHIFVICWSSCCCGYANWSKVEDSTPALHTLPQLMDGKW